jgi:hypothetical protein
MAFQRKRAHVILAICSIFTIGAVIGFFAAETINTNSPATSKIGLKYSHKKIAALQSHVKIIDLDQKISSNFTCVKTKKLLNWLQTTLCLHEIRDDVYVSGSIAQKKVWEENLVNRFIQILLKNPDYGK